MGKSMGQIGLLIGASPIGKDLSGLLYWKLRKLIGNPLSPLKVVGSRFSSLKS